MKALNIYGTNRGGTEVIRHLPQSTPQYYGVFRLVDPKPERAQAAAREVLRRFPEAKVLPLQMRARDALRETGHDDVNVVAVDTLDDILDLVSATPAAQPTLLQVVGRGPGGPLGVRIGIACALLPSDRKTKHDVQVLFETLNQMASPGSSHEITDYDPLSGLIMGGVRRVVSSRTARQLLEIDREPWDLTGGPLGCVLGVTMYPMVVAEATAGDTFRHRTELALHWVSAIPWAAWTSVGMGRAFAIAAVVVKEEALVEFMRVERSANDSRKVVGLIKFLNPNNEKGSREVPRNLRRPLIVQPARFTD